MANSARIDELRKKFDENPRRYFAPLANEYRKSGDLQQAIFICQEYLPQQPGHMSGHIVYGQALFESNRIEEAQAVFETALSLDPENLIALKHLGDIARQAGDLKAARIWYQRVLEADPRNEEIAQLMISLLAVPEAPPAAPEPVVQTPPHGREPLSREPLRHDAAPAVNDDDLVVEKSESDTPPRAVTPPTPAVVADQSAPPPPHVAESTKAGDGHDFLSLDDFNLGGGAVDHHHDAPVSASFDRPNDLTAERSDSELTLDSGFDLGTEDGPFEADPFAIASVPQSPPSASPDIELATDLHLGLPSDDDRQLLEENKPAENLSGLETFEPGVIDAPSTSSEPLEREEFFAATPGAPDPEPDATAAPTFVTETMAELYLKQGHLDSALDIYRQLVEQRPHDGALQGRLQSVETRVREESIAAAAAAAASAPAESAAPVYGGPTIREFLSGLASRRTPIFAATVESSTAMSTSGGSVSGSIDALFGGAETSANDAAAANTLQEAFAAEGPETAPLRGVPAHTASSELSLDHVFKGNAPPPPDNDGFSFDQFFADEMSDAASSAVGEGAAPSQPTDDIAQFNAWLNGLKDVKIAVLNGPNLNLLGTREPAIYGRESLDDVERNLRAVGTELGVEIDFSQHNGEGAMIDAIHAMRGHVDGVVINAGAYTHSSLAIRDALTGVSLPFVEIHVSNVYAREPERHHSMLASAAVGSICGLGVYGYELALRGLARKLAARG